MAGGVSATRRGAERRERTRGWGCPSQRSCRRSRWRRASEMTHPGLRSVRAPHGPHLPGRTSGARTGRVVRRDAEAGEEREAGEGGLRRGGGERRRCGEGRQGQPACDSDAHSALRPRPAGCAAARRASSGRRRGAEHALSPARRRCPLCPQAASRGARPLARMTRAQDTDTCRGVPGALLREPRPPPPHHHHHFGWGHPHARSDETVLATKSTTPAKAHGGGRLSSCAALARLGAGRAVERVAGNCWKRARCIVPPSHVSALANAA